MAGILIIGIVSVAVVLVIVLLWKPRSVKGKVDCEESDMVYSEAYEQNSSTSASNQDPVPKMGLVWNRAYNKCTTLEPDTAEQGHGNETQPAAEWVDPGMKEKLEKEAIYDEVSDSPVKNRLPPNEYEDVF